MSDQASAAVEAMTATLTGDGDERLAYRGVFQRLLVRPEIGAIIGAVAIWAFFWAVAGEFGKAGGILPVLAVASTLGIMAVAVSLLMIGGEFDLSSGAATGALGIVTILLVKDVGELGGAGLSLWLAIPISFVVALGLGWFNGFMVERTALPSFIVTLATFFILRGFKLGFSKLIIDNITVGRIDEGHGYDFFNTIFGSTWTRNDHQFEARDGIYTVLLLGGILLLVLAIYEFSFKRREELNPTGLIAFLGGLAGAIIGIFIMHGTDGVGSNTLAGVIFAVSGFVGFYGLGMWRYEPHDVGSVSLDTGVRNTLGGGVILFLVGILCAWQLGVESQESVLDLVGFAKWPLVVIVGLGASWYSLRKLGLAAVDGIAPEVIGQVVAVGAASAFGLYAFMFMSTEQGLRAILFAAFVIAGVTLLAMAAVRGGRISPATRSAALATVAVLTTALAFFVRGQSEVEKFRSEVFSVLLASALVIGCWALVSAFFEQRRFGDTSADNLAARLSLVGMAGIVAGLIVKLLFTTDAEIVAEIPRAQFRVEVLWFVGVTALATFVLGRTKFGSWIFAVGGNKEAARQIGVPAARTKTQLFMIVSAAAWLVGLLLAFRLNTIQSGTGNGLEFEYIIAAVVGGTFLTGGYGSAFGAAIGAMIMAMSKQGIPAARWNSDWRFAFLGVILLAAVIANNFIRSKAEASR
jgi:ribose/xylose/arabinose/galactoside ABC-type transport system permease subunit